MTPLCPACSGERKHVSFYDGGLQPLATLARFPSADAARAAPRLPLRYVRCVRCGHVFNEAFDEAKVPTSGTHPGWGMFNGAALWNEFLQRTAEHLTAPLQPGARVIEIGHGGGEFLRMIAERRQDLVCTGWDPWGAESTGRPELRRELLSPERVRSLGAELVVIRHVLEHLGSPLALLLAIGGDQRVYVEVPCIDRAIATARTVDFFYEHVQQFTTASFEAMIRRAGTILESGHGYDGEVVWAIARLGKPMVAGNNIVFDFAGEAAAFEARTGAAREAVRAELAALQKTSVAIWGGAGKGAAFIARYAMDADRFPIVVDSDPSKVGTFVAGTGQEIRDPGWLLAHPVEVIVVPPQWRARDILVEMKRKGIGGRILIEHDGRLVDYETDPHPYER